TAKSKAFVEAYAKENGDSNVPGFTALGADSYYLMIDAMNRCADGADRECVNKEIKNSKNFEGVSGIINIDKKGNAERSIVIKEIAGGKAMYKDTVNPK
ncbi:MAG: branched-chain amino acid ABC transporter substrate-binding protein, partial [Campylobacter sp.]|nr:branched-chain amino acid ABC transporter substrate-binding protein [Campylobacter sp.]